MFYMQRYIWSLVNALFITSALIYAMYLLVESPPLELSKNKVYQHLDWVHVPEDSPVIVEKDVYEKPSKVEAKPVIPRYTAKFDLDINHSVNIPEFKVKPPKSKGVIPPNDQLALVFGSPPVYPLSKLNRGIEGYAQVGFSVSPAGEVYDEFIIDAEPKGAFEKSALKAIVKFKYKPRYIDGKPVSTQGQSYVFRFRIE